MNANFFVKNRQRLGEQIGGGLIVASAYTRLQRTNDTYHRFEQESNFWYLTGINEPDWKLVYDAATHKSWLVAPDVDEVHRVFDGSLTDGDARTISGVDKVIVADELLTLYRQLARRHSLVSTFGPPSYAERFNFALNPALSETKKQLERNFARVQLINKELAQLRAIKQPEEIMAIRRAIRTTIRAFEHVSDTIADYKHEYEIEADMTQIIRRSGADGHAYDPIVASGAHATTLHYDKNHGRVQSKDLILIDVGARQDGYAADITRTYARSAASVRKQQVHGVVCQAQRDIIKLLGPELTIEEYQQSVDRIMGEAMASLGLGDAGEETMIRSYMPHAISHGLGVDVHDSLGAPKQFAEGMVLTVEPGIYLPKEHFGVRIEDDILITKHGAQNLSGALSTDLG